jgi:ferredoxin
MSLSPQEDIMADGNDRIDGNVDGKWYVDSACIACGICTQDAPDNFRFNDDESAAYVYKQPENDREAAACDEAKNSCPSDAIGDDGDE